MRDAATDIWVEGSPLPKNPKARLGNAKHPLRHCMYAPKNLRQLLQYQSMYGAVSGPCRGRVGAVSGPCRGRVGAVSGPCRGRVGAVSGLYITSFRISDLLDFGF